MYKKKKPLKQNVSISTSSFLPIFSLSYNHKILHWTVINIVPEISSLEFLKQELELGVPLSEHCFLLAPANKFTLKS